MPRPPRPANAPRTSIQDIRTRWREKRAALTPLGWLTLLSLPPAPFIFTLADHLSPRADTTHGWHGATVALMVLGLALVGGVFTAFYFETGLRVWSPQHVDGRLRVTFLAGVTWVVTQALVVSSALAFGLLLDHASPTDRGSIGVSYLFCAIFLGLNTPHG